MNSENLSSEEAADHQKEEAQDDHDDTAGTKRSYECTFCKRGFTNAQALGGHMNIHRKDRAKAKQSFPPPNKFTNDYESMVAFPFASDQSHQRNFDMYFHQPPPNPIIRNQLPAVAAAPAPAPAPAPAFPYHHEFHNTRSSSWPLHLNQELHRGPNLSLQIGPSHVDNATHYETGKATDQKENEVDLELRLGHDP